MFKLLICLLLVSANAFAGYEILHISKGSDSVNARVEFSNGEKGVVKFPADVTKDEMLLKLDSIDAAYQADETVEKNKLNADLKTIWKYKKP